MRPPEFQPDLRLCTYLQNKRDFLSFRRQQDSAVLLLTFDMTGPRRQGGHDLTITPVLAAAMKHRPRTAVRRRSLVLAQQRRVVVDAAASDVTGRPGTGSGNGRNDLDVAEVVGLAGGGAIAVACRRRAGALQFTYTWRIDKQQQRCLYLRDPEADKVQNLISFSLSIDTFVVKFSRRSVQ